MLQRNFRISVIRGWIVQKRTAEIPVEIGSGAWLFPGSVLRVLPDRIRRAALIVGKLTNNVKQSKRHTHDPDARILTWLFLDRLQEGFCPVLKKCLTGVVIDPL